MERASSHFERWFAELATIGARPGGGWHRFAWTDEDREARDWFEDTARSLIGFDVEEDGNGNLWAWWGDPGPEAVVTGSHLDTVARGGAFDGALGVVSALAAVEALQRDHGPAAPPHPIAVVAFADEEGGRFNLPCFGSKLLTGALDPAAVLDRRDAAGVSVAEAVHDFGIDPLGLGPDDERLNRFRSFVELHVEQGRGLADLDVPIAVGTGIWPHGRWRLTCTGEANHAGTTRLADRHDPVLVAAECILEARTLAAKGGLVATVGRVILDPNSPNAVAARAEVIVDARAADDATLDEFVARLGDHVTRAGADHGVAVRLELDARTSGVSFDSALNERIEQVLDAAGIASARLPTAAGHDAGILADSVPAAMLFVRNPTGASHTPSETATTADCLVGVDALTAVLRSLAWA